MTKTEKLFLEKAQTLLCDLEATKLDDENFDKWNKATLIINGLLEGKDK